METPAPPFSSTIEKPNNIKFIKEYNLNFDNIGYLLKLGIIPITTEELVILVQDTSDINSFCYQSSFSLEKLQEINKCFRQFDSVEEIIEIFKDIIEEKKILIKKINNELTVILKLKKLGKGEEEISFCLTKKNLSEEKIIENLINNINDMKSQISKLKTEINNYKNDKIFIPKFENGWNNFYQLMNL